MWIEVWAILNKQVLCACQREVSTTWYRVQISLLSLTVCDLEQLTSSLRSIVSSSLKMEIIRSLQDFRSIQWNYTRERSLHRTGHIGQLSFLPSETYYRVCQRIGTIWEIPPSQIKFNPLEINLLDSLECIIGLYIQSYSRVNIVFCFFLPVISITESQSKRNNLIHLHAEVVWNFLCICICTFFWG